MTRDEAIALMQIQLGFRSDMAANLVTCLKTAQQQLELQPTKPWFLVSEDAYRRTESTEGRLPIPSDFLQEAEDGVLYYVPDDAEDESDHVFLKKDEYDVLRKNFAETASGPPVAYCLLGAYFRMFPIPDDDYLIRMIYFQQDTVLDSNVENGWLKWAPYLLMGKAGLLLSQGGLRDSGATAVFQSWEAQGTISLHSQNVAREMANRDMQVGGPAV